MDIQLVFENPEMVSRGYYQDKIELKFKDQDFFAGAYEFSNVQVEDQILQAIPVQMYSSTQEDLDDTEDVFRATTSTLITG